MYISRGFERADEGDAAAPQTLEYLLMHDRLCSLERLARLRQNGALAESEFAAEKERILALPTEELILRTSLPPRGRSLLGRLLDWRIVVLGMLMGLALAAFAQPETAVQALAAFRL